jgi:hypothetical protein
MQGFPLRLEEDRPAYLRQEADTVHPHTPIPIFYVHDFPALFCTNPFCFCQRGKQDAAGLLSGIAEGSLLLFYAATLTQSDTTTTQPTRTVINVPLVPGVPEECQLYGHTWQRTEQPGVKECVLCHIRGYCPECTPFAPVGAQPFICTPHARQREGQR